MKALCTAVAMFSALTCIGPLHAADRPCEELAHQRMPPGRYAGPRQLMAENKIPVKYFGDLCAWSCLVDKDETLAVRAFFRGEWLELELKRKKESPFLEWTQELDNNVTAIAKGGFWKPNIYVITLRFRKEKEILCGERYFFALEAKEPGQQRARPDG